MIFRMEPTMSDVGNHLSPEEFNRAFESEETVVIDIRNHYESRIGRFEKAICPDADTFREELAMLEKMLADKKEKKVLLYCTGGIRCEKASSYLKHLGFKDVNQLYGGIINYAHEIKQKGLQSKFKGKNFVFDDRLHEKITDDVLTVCDQCDAKSDEYANCANEICNLLFIQCAGCKEKMRGCCTESCMKIATLPEKECAELRKKQEKTSYKLFKSRQRPVLK